MACGPLPIQALADHLPALLLPVSLLTQLIQHAKLLVLEVWSSFSCPGALQFMPLLAISPRFFRPVFSRYHNALLEFDAAASRLIPFQHFTFIPLLMVAKFGELNRAPMPESVIASNEYAMLATRRLMPYQPFILPSIASGDQAQRV